MRHLGKDNDDVKEELGDYNCYEYIIALSGFWGVAGVFISFARPSL